MELVVSLPIDGADALVVLSGVEPNTVPEIRILGFPAMSFEMASNVVVAALLALEPGGYLEFEFTDFSSVVGRYLAMDGVDAKLSDSLCATRPAAIWDSRSVARVLLLGGFHAVWTGQITGLVPPQTYAKGVKFNGETIAEVSKAEAPS